MSEPRPHDPCELRAAWQAGGTPLPPDRRADQDDLTREVVGWMREAWSQVPVPAPSVEQPHPPRLPASGAGWRRLAVAAALLCAVLVMARTLEGPRPDDPAASPTSDSVRGGEAPGLRADLRPDGIELRSGPVRLILIADGGDSDSSQD